MAMTDRRVGGMWPIALVGAAAVVATYWSVLHHDLAWDDYIALRPRTWSELAGVFHGTWEPRGLWPVFYRPLTIWYDALAFRLVGFAAPPLHALSLIELGAIAILTGVFVAREGGARWLGALTAALVAVHPGLAHSALPFFFLQNHLLSALIVVASLVCWQARRNTPGLGHWWPILLLAAIGLLVKEDVVVIAPALVALQWLRARVIGDLQPPSRRVVAGVLAGVAVLFTLRSVLLGELGGVPPDLSALTVARNVLRGPFRVFVQFRGFFFEDRPLYQVTSLLSLGWLSIGSWLVLRHRARAAMALWITGVTLVAFFSLALASMSMMWRYHLVTIGAVLVLAGGASAIVDWARGSAVRGALAVVGVSAALVSFCLASRAIVAPFSPCGYGTLAADLEASTWPLPLERLAWLHAAPAMCARGDTPLATDVPLLTWEVTTDASPGRRISTAGTIAMVVSARASSVVLAFRLASTSATPLHADISVDGRPAATMTVTHEWPPPVTLTLSPTWWTRARGLHDVVVRMAPEAGGLVPTLEWRPARVRER